MGFIISGLLFCVSGLIWAFRGDAAMSAMFICIGMMFTVLGLTR